jgi:hypothetical protein
MEGTSCGVEPDIDSSKIADKMFIYMKRPHVPVLNQYVADDQAVDTANREQHESKS